MRQRRNIDAKHRERLASQFSGIGHNNIQNWGLPSILRTVELLHLPYTDSLCIELDGILWSVTGNGVLRVKSPRMTVTAIIYKSLL